MRKSDEKSGNRRRDGVVKGVLKYVKERELGRARYLDRGRLCKSLTPCHVPISTIIDEERKILSCVILGFSADSNYLISYQRCFGLTPFGEGGSDEDCSFSFTLQFWLFEGPQNRLRCTYETELFDGEKFETSQLQAVSGAIVYVENESSGLCLVHYETLGPCGFFEHHITVLASPTNVEAASRKVHLKYQVYEPFPKFDPDLSVFSQGRLLILVLNTGAAYKIVTFVSLNARTSESDRADYMRASTNTSKKANEASARWWKVEEICTPLSAKSEKSFMGPLTISQRCFDIEDFIMDSFNEMCSFGRISRYSTRVLRSVGENLLFVSFHVTCFRMDSRTSHSCFTTLISARCIDILMGTALALTEALPVFTESQSDPIIKSAVDNETAELESLLDSVFDTELHASKWQLDDRNVELGRPLSRLEHPWSKYVITGYHGGR